MRRALAIIGLVAFLAAAWVGNTMFDDHEHPPVHDCEDLNRAYKAASWAWDAGPVRPYLIRPGESSAEHLARISAGDGPYLSGEDLAAESLRLYEELNAARNAYREACT